MLSEPTPCALASPLLDNYSGTEDDLLPTKDSGFVHVVLSSLPTNGSGIHAKAQWCKCADELSTKTAPHPACNLQKGV